MKGPKITLLLAIISSASITFLDRKWASVNAETSPKVKYGSIEIYKKIASMLLSLLDLI
jgi:hypothetical protein